MCDWLILKTRQRNDLHSIKTSVSHASTCHNNKQIGFPKRYLFFCFVVLLYEPFEFELVFSSFINLATTKFALY